MIVRLIKIETDRKVNIRGKVIERRHEYVIELLRWFRRPVYLRLNGGWWEDYEHGRSIPAQLTYSAHHATAFKNAALSKYGMVEMARELINIIKHDPDRFVLD